MIMLGGCTARGFSFYKTKHANHAVKQRRTHDQLRLMPFYGATASNCSIDLDCKSLRLMPFYGATARSGYQSSEVRGLRLMPFYGATASQIAKGDPKSEIAMRKSREPVKNE